MQVYCFSFVQIIEEKLFFAYATCIIVYDYCSQLTE